MTKKKNIYKKEKESGFAFSGRISASEKNILGKPKRIFSDKSYGAYLFQADCLEMMDEIIKKHPDGIFDMIFADPPYFLSNGGISCQSGKMVSVNKGKWDNSKGVEKNHEFNIAWLSRCQKLLKPNGTIWISGTAHVIYSIGFAMQQIGFKFLNDIIWEKPNPPPNLSCRYFTHATETIIWASKNSKSKHCFNYDLMKNVNGGKQMKSVWRILPPAKSEKLEGRHPTQKPIELIERCILASTNENAFVFDPFAGSSTTGIAALRTGRQYCGVELEDDFVRLSLNRLTAEIDNLNSKLIKQI